MALKHLRARIHPGLRGTFFYAAFWGAVGMYEPFLSLYFLRQGATDQQIGWLAAVLPLCVMVLAPLVTRLADRFHRRVVILGLACLGYGAALLLPSVPGLHPGFGLLVGLVALFAVFRSPIVSLADSLVTHLSTQHALDFGGMRLWGSIAFTITAVGLGAVWERTGFGVMFLLAGVAFLPVALTALLLEEPAAVIQPAAARPAQAAHPRFTPDPGVLFLLGATFMSVASLFMAGTFGAVYMTQLGGSQALVGALMGMSAFGEVPGMLYGARLARRMGETNALILSYLVMAVGLAGYALIQIPWVLVLFSAVRGLGFGLNLVSTVMIINSRAPRDLAATYQGILNAACWGLAPLLGGPISGWIYQNHGPAALFYSTAGMALLSALLISPTYRLWKKKG